MARLYAQAFAHYVSVTKPNRLMLFRETVAVYCENHTEHTNTLCGQNAVYINPVRTSQEPPSMCRMSENVGASTSRNAKGLHGLYRDSFTLLYVTGNTLRLRYKAQPVNAV
jgi:hypothetical protein